METTISSADLMGCRPDSIFKLNVQFIEEEDGSGTITIEWDEEDADLQWWTDLGEKKQKQFILESLTAAYTNLLEDNDD